jgi:predicted nucleic acid-binding protein
MTKLLVVDANVLVALSSERDALHSRAEALSTALAQANAEIVLLDCVVTEALSVLARRLNEQKRSAEFVQRLDSFLQRFPVEDWFWVTNYARGWMPDILDVMRISSGRLNFNDALIAVACRKLGEAVLISFDADFDEISGLVRCSTAPKLQKL